MDLICSTTIDGDHIDIYKEKYHSGNLAIQLIVKDPDGFQEPYARLSVNPDDPKQLADDEFAVKDWSENAHLVAVLRSQKLFTTTKKMVMAGYEVAEVWKLK